MSTNLSSLLEKQFEAEVHHEFQALAKDYKQYARTRFIKAKKTQFPVFGRTQMKKHVVGQPIEASKGSRTPVEVTVEEYSAGDWTDVFMNEQVSFDERTEFAKSLAMAMQRQGFQLIIDALNATTSTSTVAKNISGANDNLTVAAIREAGKLLDKNNVPNDGNRIMLVHANNLHHLLEEPEVTSSDFTRKMALETGKLENFYGFDILTFGDMDEGGLPISGNDRTCFFYHKMALGLAVNLQQRVEIDYYNTHSAHFVSGIMAANAKEIDPLGVGKIIAAEA